ncbi:MAG: hypothetical protein ACFFAE_22880 [Candidatus Hodarchaeota archaeon]
MAEIIINVKPEEVLIWILEIIFVTLLLVLIEYYLLKRKEMETGYLLKILVSAVLIVLILPSIGFIAMVLEFQDRTFYSVGVVFVFAITALIIYYIIKEHEFNRVILLTTILLAVLYTVRIIFNVGIL